jgi:putative transposase
MNLVFKAIGISKQSFHQKLSRQLSHQKESSQLLPRIREIRKYHPNMSSRSMHGMIGPVHLGRDRFESFCFENGFKIAVKRAFHRTTNSLGVTRFENLIFQKRVTGVNRVWASDITYYRIGEKFYYLTFIIDLYSRFVVGYSISETLLTEHTTIPALKMAMKTRIITEGLIIHSDGGGQYYAKEWLDLTTRGRMRNSMCESVYENAHAERLNGIIKNDYLRLHGPQNYQQLITMTNQTVFRYNYERPHQSLGKISPDQFEKSRPPEAYPQSFKKKKSNKKRKNALYVDNSRELPTYNALLQQQ